MDLTIPYTFYSIALPHWIAWLLFLLAMAGGTGVGVLKSRDRGWRSGLGAGSIGLVGLLAASMVVSMIITLCARPLSSEWGFFGRSLAGRWSWSTWSRS